MNTNSRESLIDEIKLCFDVAAMNREARLGLSGRQWQQYRALGDGFAKTRAALESTYRREFDTRVEVKKRKLIDKAAAKTLEFKHPVFGRDAFDGAALTRQAAREVRFDHEAQIMALDIAERQEKEKLLSESSRKNKQRGKSKDEFAAVSRPKELPIRTSFDRAR